MAFSINVVVVEGTNFPLVDCVVEITCGERSQMTSSKAKATDPKWNELFEFDVTSLSQQVTFNRTTKIINPK
jgi:hypothetical protein